MTLVVNKRDKPYDVYIGRICHGDVIALYSDFGLNED